MKTNLFEFYQLNEADLNIMWKDAMFVLDTNILLNLYRLPHTAREDYFRVLESLQERIWIPFHVALEFQRRRTTVISNERKGIDDSLEFVKSSIPNLKAKIENLQIDKRNLGIDISEQLLGYEASCQRLIESIEAVSKAQPNIYDADSIRDRIDSILEGKIGPAPKDQKEYDALIEKADERFKEKIPPGFMDVDKEKNPNEATFTHNHIKIQRKHGDLIIWKQIIEYVKVNQVKNLILITGDKKDDWWRIEHGKTLGPHPELLREIKREGDVERFWMYSTLNFIEKANEYLSTKVSSESVAEIRDVADSDSQNDMWAYLAGEVNHKKMFLDGSSVSSESRDRTNYVKIEEYVTDWIVATEGWARTNYKGFPDVITGDESKPHGFEIKYINQFSRMVVSPSVVNGLLRGYYETHEGRLSKFTMIIVISKEDANEIISNRIYELVERVERLLEKYPIYSIAVGYVNNGQFELIEQQYNR